MKGIQQKLLEQNTELLVAVGKMEEHLSSINGEIQSTKKFKDGCPIRMKEFDEKLNCVQNQLTKNTTYLIVGWAFISLVLTIIGPIIVNRFNGG